MKIGNIKIDNNIFLAPMAGITDAAFRLLCKEKGCGLVYTEMVSAKGFQYNNKRTQELLEFDMRERPLGVQLFGREPEILSETARRLNDTDVDLIDINMGCPTPKIVKNGEGAFLMKEPERVAAIVKMLSDASEKPVTVKIRKGWDDKSVNAVEIAKICEANGAAAITVHGRTREQFYRGKADREIIRQVKEAVKIPVIGNGDIFKPQDAVEMFRQTGCEAVMIARGAQGNPWIFENINEYIENGILIDSPDAQEVIDMIVRHMNMLIEMKGERIGLLEMRKHISWYIKGFRNAAHLRQEIYKTTSKSEIESILEESLRES